MTRAWTPSEPYETHPEEQLASLAVARAKFAETRTWAYYTGRVSPERLHNGELTTKSDIKYVTKNTRRAKHNVVRIGARNKEQLCDNLACELVCGRYTMRKKAQQCATKKHQCAVQSQRA